METAIRLATGQGLFCSMTLQGLFRSGDLLPTDLEEISNPGFQLLHDPLLSNLYQTGLIGKRELLELTKNQIESLLICRPALLSKKLAMKEVLALTAEQMQSMRVAKLLDLLYAERITLSEALKLAHDLSISNSMQASAGLKLATVAIMIPFPELPDCSLYFKLKPPFLSDSPVLLKQFQLRKLLSKTPITTVTKALDTGGDLTWFVEFGKVIHHLHPNVIVQHLDTSTMAHRCIFARFDDGLDSNGAEEAALAYIQLYISLAGKLDSEDYLLVVQPFLQDVFGWMVADACRRDHGDIIDQCSKVFTLALTKWMLTARPQAQLWDLVMPQFKQHCAELDLLNSSAECYCLISFARLLCAMSLMHNVEFFKFWGAGDDYDRPEDADMEAHEYRPYFMQALYSPFNPVESGARILDSIAGYIDKHR